MQSIIEKVDISITTKRNALPIEKPVAGRFRISENCSEATFCEEDATIIYGEKKSERVMRGRHCAVYWNREKGKYRISITIDPRQPGFNFLAECDFDDCLNAIKRRMQP